MEKSKKTRVLNGELLKKIIKDLNLESIKEYTSLKKSGKLGKKFPTSLYSYCKCRVQELFGTKTFLSMDGMINLVHMGIDTPEKLELFKQKFPTFIPNNWKSHYGVKSIDEFLECDDTYGVDLPFLIEAIHGEVEYKELHTSPEKYFFSNDKEAYLIVLNYLSREEYHGAPIQAILKNDSWKFDSIKNYLQFDGILKKTKYGIHQIGSKVNVSDLINRILSGDHPICDGINDEHSLDIEYDYECRLAKYRKSNSSTSLTDSNRSNEVVSVVPTDSQDSEGKSLGLTDEEWKEIDNDLNNDGVSTNELIIEINGMPIVYKNKTIGSITIDGNKIKITTK